MSEARDVGSLGDETAKLFDAFAGWAREHAGEASDGLSGFAAHAAASAQGLNEHLATGAAECSVCPVCRAMHGVRQLSPEVTAHLGDAATSLARAASALLRHGPGDRTTSSDVERIELDDECSDPPS